MPLWAWALVLMVASFILESLVVKPAQIQKPAALQDFDFPQVEDGTPHAVIFGDVWLNGPMVIWYGNMRTKKIKSSGGKKG